MRRIVIVCFIAGPLLAGCGAEAGSTAAEYAVEPDVGVVLTVREVSFGRLHERTDITSIEESPDGRHLAYRVFTPFLVHTPREHVVLDGVAGKTYGRIKGAPVFSPDSKRLAYVAGHHRDVTGEKNTFSVVIDGVEGKEYRSIQMGPIFSPDSKRVAYVATRERDRRFAVVDGREHKAYAWVVPHFSPDGRRFVSLVSEDYGRRRRPAIDGVEIKRTTTGPSEFPTFSPDGRHMALVVAKDEGACVSVDGVDGPVYDEAIYPVFSRDGKHVAYRARRDGRWMVVRDGVESKPYDGIGDVALSPDGRRIGFEATRTGARLLVIDGKEITRYSWTGPPIFSSDSKHVAFLAVRGDRSMVVRDDVEGRPYDGIRKISLKFSPRGARLLYSAWRGEQSMAVVDGVEGAGYDRIFDPAFSPDGRHVAYKAQRGKKWLVVVDGQETREVDGSVERTRIRFESSDRVNCIAHRGGTYFRMEMTISMRKP